MRRLSFLAALRSRDGRSLARAMAILVTLNLFAAGLHSGAMAAPADGSGLFVLCAAASSGPGDPAAPVQDHQRSCCFAGCQPAPVALTAEPQTVCSVPGYHPVQAEAAAADTTFAGVFHSPNARGPPVLA